MPLIHVEGRGSFVRTLVPVCDFAVEIPVSNLIHDSFPRDGYRSRKFDTVWHFNSEVVIK
jgi:hypothetical protein